MFNNRKTEGRSPLKNDQFLNFNLVSNYLQTLDPIVDAL